MAELPETWKTFEDGTPVPNWVAAVDDARRGIAFTAEVQAANRPEAVRRLSTDCPADDNSSQEYPERMPQERDNLKILAAARQSRLQSDGCPRFDLTDSEIERSTQTAMRLADASKSQAETRANSGASRSA